MLILAGGWSCAAVARQAEPDDGDENPSQLLETGVAQLRAGRIEQSLKKLDRLVEISPASEPYLWQRGIAQYFAGQFEAGRRQFESHRLVNPNDVENATWHFLCVAASENVESAREKMLPAPNDFRVPQKEIYQMFKGTGSVADVDAAVQALPEGSAARANARFYADLYIGLLAHAEGDKESAAKFLTAAAETKDRGVMADVARVSRKMLVQFKAPRGQQSDAERPEPKPSANDDPEGGSQ
jgi:lipoprotein NlpI